MKKIIIIGGGASGLMAAITAARCGAGVTLLETNEVMGKKICATGNGHCNFTNQRVSATDYMTEGAFGRIHPLIKSVLSGFTVNDTLVFFESLGMFYTTRGGLYYPRSNQASTLRNLLVREAASYGVKLKTNARVTEIITGDKPRFIVKTSDWQYEADALILACGSKASSISGADGSGYDLAESLGHTIIKPLPALTGLKAGNPGLFSAWAGIRTAGSISLSVNNKIIFFDTGELQLTDYGVSGIPAFQTSRIICREFKNEKNIKVLLDFLPEYSPGHLLGYLRENADKDQRDILLGILPDKLVKVILSKKCSTEELVKRIKAFSLDITGTLGFDKAQICAGGVFIDELDPQTLESKICPGLYMAGELLDVDGPCGGYNLQWAWSSGYMAGKNASSSEN